MARLVKKNVVKHKGRYFVKGHDLYEMGAPGKHGKKRARKRGRKKTGKKSALHKHRSCVAKHEARRKRKPHVGAFKRSANAKKKIKRACGVKKHARRGRPRRSR